MFVAWELVAGLGLHVWAIYFSHCYDVSFLVSLFCLEYFYYCFLKYIKRIIYTIYTFKSLGVGKVFNVF